MFKIITIPFDRSTKSFDEDLLNRVVVNKQVKTCRAELMRDGGEYFPLVPKLGLGNVLAWKLQLPSAMRG